MDKLKNFGRALFELIKILTISFVLGAIIVYLLLLLNSWFSLILNNTIVASIITGVLVLFGISGIIYWIDYT